MPQPELTAIGKVAEKYILDINGISNYVIMPNHIHLLIVKHGSNSSVSEDIRSIKTLVTKEIGYSVWQPRFYDHIIRNDEDYYEHLKYIEENPLKWSLDKYYTME